MAFKLTRDEIVAKAELAEAISKAWDTVESAVMEYNEKVEQAKVEMREVVTAFNDVAGQVAVFAAGVADRANLEFDERSEKWQEGEDGQAATAWKDEWDDFDSDGIENVDWPEELVIEQPMAVDMDALPEE
jgi:division protein CdvB (Snf7/Vps24/ESCRT-III family)